MTSRSRLFLALLSIAFASPAIAAEPAKPATKPAATRPAAKPKAPQRHQLIDHGPFVTATIPSQWEEHGITNKAIAVRLESFRAPGAAKNIGGILFDTDTCRVAAGWQNGFVDFTKDWTSVRDAKSVKLVGSQIFGTSSGPGWAKPGASDDAMWKDPRPQGLGPLPDGWMKYKGLYRNGNSIVLSYAVGNCNVLESAALDEFESQSFFVRLLEIGPSDQAMTLLVAERAGANAKVEQGMVSLDLEGNGKQKRLRVTTPHQMDGVEWLTGAVAGNGRVLLRIPPRPTVLRIPIFLWTAVEPVKEALLTDDVLRTGFQRMGMEGNAKWFRDQTEGGPALWPQTITTTGKLGVPKADAPYVVDTITLPDNNPWQSWMRPGGFDFFTSDPTKAAVCNWSGDVWTVSGLTGDLKELKWRRIASGLFQSLGLRIVNDQIYVLGRDQITRLVDLNGDGETDFYECFNNDMEVTSNFHEFTFDLQTDKAGNFYFAKGAPVRNGGQGFETIAAHHGSVLKLSPDGKTLERYATGFRAPTGISVGPDGQVTAGDNEGTWVPKCRLAYVKAGGFYGVVPTSHRNPPPTDYDRPLCWFPKNVDNSSGGQAWVTSNQWGPFENRLLHLSYGTCSLFLAMKQDLPGGGVQGGVVRFPLSFDSGILRARFHPTDGQLYVAGLKGWQTSAGRDGCFQRVRYTGKPVHMPTAISASKTGLTLTFTTKLNADEANDPESYAIERWNYIWGDRYGSPDVSVEDPTKSTHDSVKIKSAKLQADGKTVVLEIPDMKPAMQYKTDINLTSAEGADIRYEIYHSVHQVE